ILRGMKQRWGSPAAKRVLWNKEFAQGRWDHINDTSGDVIYAYIEKYSKNGSILDLGCGSGNTGCEVRIDAYRNYTGVDISDVAIERATRRSQALGRSDKNRYYQSDIMAYRPTQKYDVILFRESIYYIPRRGIKETLDRYCQFLKEEGVFVIRCSVTQQGEDILGSIGSEYRTVEKYSPASGPLVAILAR